MQASNTPTSNTRFHIRAPTYNVSASIPTSTNNIRPNAPEQPHSGRLGNHCCAHCKRRKIRCLPTETSLWPCFNCVRLNRHCQPPDEDVENDIEAPHSYDGKNDPGLAEPGGDRHPTRDSHEFSIPQRSNSKRAPDDEPERWKIMQSEAQWRFQENDDQFNFFLRMQQSQQIKRQLTLPSRSSQPSESQISSTEHAEAECDDHKEDTLSEMIVSSKNPLSQTFGSQTAREQTSSDESGSDNFVTIDSDSSSQSSKDAMQGPYSRYEPHQHDNHHKGKASYKKKLFYGRPHKFRVSPDRYDNSESSDDSFRTSHHRRVRPLSSRDRISRTPGILAVDKQSSDIPKKGNIVRPSERYQRDREQTSLENNHKSGPLERYPRSDSIQATNASFPMENPEKSESKLHVSPEKEPDLRLSSGEDAPLRTGKGHYVDPLFMVHAEHQRDRLQMVKEARIRDLPWSIPRDKGSPHMTEAVDVGADVRSSVPCAFSLLPCDFEARSTYQWFQHVASHFPADDNEVLILYRIKFGKIFISFGDTCPICDKSDQDSWKGHQLADWGVFCWHVIHDHGGSFEHPSIGPQIYSKLVQLQCLSEERYYEIAIAHGWPANQDVLSSSIVDSGFYSRPIPYEDESMRSIGKHRPEACSRKESLGDVLSLEQSTSGSHLAAPPTSIQTPGNSNEKIAPSEKASSPNRDLLTIKSPNISDSDHVLSNQVARLSPPHESQNPAMAWLRRAKVRTDAAIQSYVSSVVGYFHSSSDSDQSKGQSFTQNNAFLPPNKGRSLERPDAQVTHKSLTSRMYLTCSNAYQARMEKWIFSNQKSEYNQRIQWTCVSMKGDAF